jgi:hypothetical protein
MVNRVVIDEAAVRAFASDPSVVHELERSGFVQDVVSEMQRLGSRVSQEGADSIGFELDPSGDFYRVTWGFDEFYMWFFEVGTLEIAPQPFARPTADAYNRRR